MHTSTRRPALLTTPDGDALRCRVCARQCRISEGERGFCGVRQNDGGTLYTESYGAVTAAGLDPVEKKPLYHYLPGTQTFSLSSYGCNFTCRHCQNFTLSQNIHVPAAAAEPEEIIRQAQKTAAQSISFTYNEPVINYEYVLDISRLAQTAGLGTALITNGYLTEDALTGLAPYTGAVRIDLKAFTDGFYRIICGARLQPVLDTILRAKDLGLHIELVTLIIPGYNDSEEEINAMLSWELDHLGPAVPHHFTAFTPMYQMEHVPPTPPETLDRIYRQAHNAGLYYPYLGNIMHLAGSSTRCPACGELLILRAGYVAKFPGLRDGKCIRCGRPLEGVFQPPQSSAYTD